MMNNLAKIGVIVLCINIMLTIGGVSTTLNLAEEINQTAVNISSANLGTNPFDLAGIALTIIGIVLKMSVASLIFLSDAGIPAQVRMLIGLPIALLNIYFIFGVLYYSIGILKKRIFG